VSHVMLLPAHFYFGDETGTPGTILTFFPFPQASRGSRGSGEATIIGFSIPRDSIDFWIERLSRNNITFDGPDQKFNHHFLSFSDPDGMQIELVEDDVVHLPGWEIKDLPREHSIRKFFGTTIQLNNSKPSEKLLIDLFGFRLQASEKNIKRFISGEGDQQARFDIHTDSGAQRAIQSAGSIHHIAWRTENDTSQVDWSEKLGAHGYHTTPVIDRTYFRSIYFREPGGVLFEIATDTPGFMIDEEEDKLGETLKLPPMYESRRDDIESRLIPIRHKNTMVTA